MTTYDEDFIKQVMEFKTMLYGEQFKNMLVTSDPKLFTIELKSLLFELRSAIQVLYIVAENEMRETNRIRDILTKLPDSKAFKELKQELEAQKNNTIETLLPIKKLADAIQESKNKKVGYIG